MRKIGGYYQPHTSFVPQPKNTNPSCYLAFFYADIYHHLNDSLNRAIASNRADVALTKLDFEKTTSKIQLLLQEKQSTNKSETCC
jgi:hypothetical protein